MDVMQSIEIMEKLIIRTLSSVFLATGTQDSKILLRAGGF